MAEMDARAKLAAAVADMDMDMPLMLPPPTLLGDAVRGGERERRADGGGGGWSWLDIGGEMGGLGCCGQERSLSLGGGSPREEVDDGEQA